MDYDWDKKDMDPPIGHTGFVKSIKFSRDSKKIISASTDIYEDETLRVRNVDNNSISMVLTVDQWKHGQ